MAVLKRSLMRFWFCPLCGTKLSQRDLCDDKNIPWCDKCNRPWFDMSYCCVIVLVRVGNKYVLVCSRNLDGKTDENRYVLVAGHINTGESPENAAVREVYEELGLKAKTVRLINIYQHPTKDMLMAGYFIEAENEDIRLSHELLDYALEDKKEALQKLKDSKIAYRLLEDIKE